MLPPTWFSHLALSLPSYQNMVRISDLLCNRYGVAEKRISLLQEHDAWSEKHHALIAEREAQSAERQAKSAAKLLANDVQSTLQECDRATQDNLRVRERFEASLQDARRQLAELQAKAQRKQDTEEAVKSAVDEGAIRARTIMIERAEEEEEDLHQQSIAEAREHLAALQEQVRRKEAIEDEGLKQQRVAEAKGCLAALQLEARPREAAEEALKKASQAGTRTALARVLMRAEKAGVARIQSEDARHQLAKLQAKLSRMPWGEATCRLQPL